MGGFLLDSLISSIVKKIRTKSRVSRAEEWPVAEGKVSKVIFNKRGSLIAPCLSYAYEVNGETHYGSAMCFSIDESQENVTNESTNALQVLRVRYNPGDPWRVGSSTRTIRSSA